ncbi:MAG: DNA polymerase III subunit beta [Bdellovibrionaceae bacterium]|nr:DNA polymerase III subunit beta [Pseudobdellovibrionaceae bacterium]
MKIKVQKKDLGILLTRAQNIVEKRNNMPVLINILMETKNNELKIFATDLEVSLIDKTKVITEKEGQVVVNAKSLFDLIKELDDGEIQLEKQSNSWLKIKQGKSVFNIVGIKIEEYPIFPKYTTKQFTKVESGSFLEMIDKTLYGVSTDETRHHLNGVYFENNLSKQNKVFRMVATDGHRLCMVDRDPDIKNEEPKSGVIIPKKGLNEIRKLLETIDGEFEIAIEGAQLIVKHEPTTLMIRLIDGVYPDYTQLIPQNLNENIKIEKEKLMSILKRVSLLSNQKSKGVTLNINKGKLEITSYNPELGDAQEEIPVNYSGDPIKIGFNAKYILDVLSSIKEEKEIVLSVKDNVSPGIIQPEGDKRYKCVIMPMRM